jgi:hypothetical protein
MRAGRFNPMAILDCSPATKSARWLSLNTYAAPGCLERHASTIASRSWQLQNRELAASGRDGRLRTSRV